MLRWPRGGQRGEDRARAWLAAGVGGWSAGQLGNNGDTLRLEDPAGTVADEVTYGSEGDWASRRRGPLSLGHQGWVWTTPADGGGSSMELVDPILGNDSGQNWAPS